MSSQEICDAIPHRSPMLLVDEIVERSDERIVCRKIIREDEFFLQGHYPDFPIVPGVILCEVGMQAGAILLSRLVADGEGVPIATRLNDVKFKKMVKSGDTVESEVVLDERLAGTFFLSAKLTVGGKLVARFSFACSMASPQFPV